MKALVLRDIGQLEYTDEEMPSPKKGEVLVRVMAAGICGSDIPRAYRDGAHNMPLIIGHEFSGCVEKVGEGVSDDWIGKRVGIFPLIPCKKCGPCRHGRYEMCRDYSYLGSRCNGGFADYVSVPEWNLIGLPDTVSYEAAAMLEPMAVAVHAMRQCLNGSADGRDISGKDRNIAVIGLGTIGTLLVQFLQGAGYKNLLVIGNKAHQKNTMLGIGMLEENYCNSRTDDVHDFIMDRTDGNGADVFFECVGSCEAANIAVDCTAPAGNVCFVGNPHSDMTFEKAVYWKILRNQLKIHGTWNSSFLGGTDGENDDWHYVIKCLEAKTVDPQKLITHKYPLGDIISGFELMRDRTEDYIKVMYVRV